MARHTEGEYELDGTTKRFYQDDSVEVFVPFTPAFYQDFFLFDLFQLFSTAFSPG